MFLRISLIVKGNFTPPRLFFDSTSLDRASRAQPRAGTTTCTPEGKPPKYRDLRCARSQREALTGYARLARLAAALAESTQAFLAGARVAAALARAALAT